MEPYAYWESISQNAELTASDGLPGDGFGFAVSISNGGAVVGAPFATAKGNLLEGAAYDFGDLALFGLGGGWQNESEAAGLYSADNVAGEHFGWSVSISVATSPNSEILSGVTIVVGAPDDTVNANGLQGAAFVFAYSAAGGAVAAPAQLTSSDGVAGDDFGISVAASGDTIAVGAENAAGGVLPAEGTAYTFATGAPIAVTTGDATGTYGAGTTIPIAVTFSDDVTVTGTPQLTLNDGAVGNYAGGSGTTTLTFMYTVLVGDAAADLDYASTAALSLNGGTITDVLSGLPATLTLPAPGTLDGLAAANIVIDTPPPTVTKVYSTEATGAYGTGTAIPIYVDFSDVVTVTGTPEFALNAGGGAVAVYTGGSGTDELTFTYTVAAGQSAADLDYASTTALSFNGGTIRSATSGLPATLTLSAPGPGDGLAADYIVIDTTPPTVTGVSTQTTGYCAAGTDITIDVTFSEPVSVALSALSPTARPQLALNDGEVAAYYGIPGSTITFDYNVFDGDNTQDLDYASTGALTLNGCTIRDAMGNAAVLTLPPTGSDGLATKGVVVNTTPPAIVSIVGPSVAYTTHGPVTYTATYADTNFNACTLTPDDIKLETGTGHVTGTVAVSGTGLTRTVTISNILGDGTMYIYIDPGTATDLAGNEAPGVYSWTSFIVQNTPPAVTATSSTQPAGTYAAGTAIPISVTFNVAVTVTGTPELALNAGGGAAAVYSSGSGTTTLTFTYTVGAGQSTSDLECASTTALSLNGGTIDGTFSGLSATLTLPPPSALDQPSAKSIVIDAPGPALAPAAPILIGPGSSASPGPTVSGTAQTFRWDKVTGATSYRLEVKDVTAGTATKA